MEYVGNPSPVHRLFEVTEKLEEKAVSRLLIPDNVLKRMLQNVYFIWGEGTAVADELGRKYGLYVYHTCENRFKHSQNADSQFQPGLCRIVGDLDFFMQDPEDAMQRENEIIHDFTPMVIMDLIQLTAKHEKVICENDIDIDSIIQFVTHAVTISNFGPLDDFIDQYKNKILRRDISKDEKERLIHSVSALKANPQNFAWRSTSQYGVKQIIWEENSTVEQTADTIAEYFGLSHPGGYL